VSKFDKLLDIVSDINEEELRAMHNIIEESNEVEILRDIIMDTNEEQYVYFTRS
jgi:hypothetical protein